MEMEGESMIKMIWRRNLNSELSQIDAILGTHKIIAFDTEFPGFLRNTPRDASEALRYEDLKFNVDHLKLIQLGLTLYDDEGNLGGTWQINFCDFDVDVDSHVPASIHLLRRNGVDFEKNKREGVDVVVFAVEFKEIMLSHRGIKWVSFHGLYDLAYLLRLLTQKEIPNSPTEFADMAGTIFRHVYNVKFMAKYCHGLVEGGSLVLERLSKMLRVDRVGEAHQAGSDSLLTAGVFLKMVRAFGLVTPNFERILYGITVKIEKKRPLLIHYYRPILRCPPPYLVAPPPRLYAFSSHPLCRPVFICQ